jgi:hypothetical protein
MQTTFLKIRSINSFVLLIMVIFFCWPIHVDGASILGTEKDIYNEGEMIKISFSNAPGNDGDWICVVPAGSPDTEAGDYKYMPKGLSQGVLTFDPPTPGKYEARAYYNYNRNGYIVTGRYAFSVVSTPEGRAAMLQLMERKIDLSNPLEADLKPGQGLVYIFREAAFGSSSSEAQINANGTSSVFISNSSYFPFPVTAGDVKFTLGSISTVFQIETGRQCEATIKVKPGYVYYLSFYITPRPNLAFFLVPVPYQKAADIIKDNKLTLLKR